MIPHVIILLRCNNFIEIELAKHSYEEIPSSSPTLNFQFSLTIIVITIIVTQKGLVKTILRHMGSRQRINGKVET